jgi:protein required for attachment to host cells
MNKRKIPHNAIVFIGDGQKALFLRNAGDQEHINLKAERVFVDDNPPTHAQGTDRPGRTFARAATHRSSQVGTTDWHELEKHRFAERVAAALEKLMREREASALIVAAPPRTLADLRQVLHADVKKRIIAEIGKDLTKHSVADIEDHLTS